MEEVVGRRYRRLREENKAFPDLVVIDGGQGQVGASLKAFVALDLEPPALIGLAKKRETIIFPDERPPLNLPLNHPGLQLLQRLRDEAHRFANTYNADLRSKKIRESRLDDFAGLGPVRRGALLAHFGGIDRLRAAGPEEIREVAGFGPKLAAALQAFLHRQGPAPVIAFRSRNPMKTLRLEIRLFLVLGGAIAARANVELASLFSDHAVLQREKPVPVWGRADPGEHGHGHLSRPVRRGGRGSPTDAGWRLLPASPANAVGSDLVVSGKNTLTLHDVVVGEVWLCSGQSNMEFVVANPPGATFRVQNADAEVAAARYPLIRQFLVGRKVADKPMDTATGSWTPCSPETVGRFTAVGYFFARDLHRRLGVPVGLIDSTWGGTPVESWMSPAALGSDPAFAVVQARWKQSLAEFPQRFGRSSFRPPWRRGPRATPPSKRVTPNRGRRRGRAIPGRPPACSMA